jgi:hypothetical protein
VSRAKVAALAAAREAEAKATAEAEATREADSAAWFTVGTAMNRYTEHHAGDPVRAVAELLRLLVHAPGALLPESQFEQWSPFEQAAQRELQRCLMAALCNANMLAMQDCRPGKPFREGAITKELMVI